MTQISYNWYAVKTRPRSEKKVAVILSDKGIENYCPLNKVIKQWSDRKKIVLEPLFKSYVFVKVDEQKKWDLKKVNGILNYVYWLGKPAKIKEEEINTIKKFLNEFGDVKVQPINLHLNQKVRIKQGILMNYEGILIEIFGNRAVVRIESLDIQLNAHFHKQDIQPV